MFVRAFVLSKSVVVTSGCCVAEMYKLMVACLCVMVGNAEAERVFSCQNRVKTKQRTCLMVERSVQRHRGGRVDGQREREAPRHRRALRHVGMRHEDGLPRLCKGKLPDGI